MKDFKPIEQTAESVEKAAKVAEGRMTFIQEFLQKKYGFGILFFVLILAAIWIADDQRDIGKKEGAISSSTEILSLKNSLTNRNSEITTLKNSVTNYQQLYDDCIKKSNNVDLEDEVRKALEKSERLERILDRKIITTEKQTNDFNTLIPKK